MSGREGDPVQDFDGDESASANLEPANLEHGKMEPTLYESFSFCIWFICMYINRQGRY